MPWGGYTVQRSHYRPELALGLQQVEVPRFQDSRHIKVVKLSALRTGRLYPPTIYFWYTFLLEAESNLDRRTAGTFMLLCIVIDFFLNNQPDALIIQIVFCYKTVHVSGNFFAHHQEFCTVLSALACFMQVFGDRFQAESG